MRVGSTYLWQVTLCERDNDGAARGACVRQRLARLRHHAVIRRHDQHGEVRHGGTAGAHGAEGGVAGGVQEGEGRAAVWEGHLEGADVLRWWWWGGGGGEGERGGGCGGEGGRVWEGKGGKR